MSAFDRHFAYWPPGVPKTLTPLRSSLHYNLEVSARRYPGKAAIVYYGTAISYAELERDVAVHAQRVAAIPRSMNGRHAGECFRRPGEGGGAGPNSAVGTYSLCAF